MSLVDLVFGTSLFEASEALPSASDRLKHAAEIQVTNLDEIYGKAYPFVIIFDDNHNIAYGYSLLTAMTTFHVKTTLKFSYMGKKAAAVKKFNDKTVYLFRE